MAYRFVLADGVDSERVHLSNAAGTYLLGTPLDEDELEPVDAIEVEDSALAALLRDEPVLKEEGSDLVPAADQPSAPNLTGLVPESVAERNPDAFRNTDADRIVPDDELAGALPPAEDDSSPDTVDAGDPGEPSKRERREDRERFEREAAEKAALAEAEKANADGDKEPSA